MPAPAAIWHSFTSAPHRVMFALGLIQTVLPMLWWALELAARHSGLPPPPTPVVPGGRAHAYLMIYGPFPALIFGFLMTTFPRWLGGVALSPRDYLPAFAGLAAGALVFYPGIFLDPRLAALGVALSLAGWGLGLRTLRRVHRLSLARDRHYENRLLWALAAGWLGALAYLSWLLGAPEPAYLLARTLGLWLFLAPVIVTVGHRMIPFFSQVVLRPYTLFHPLWSLQLLLLGLLAHGLNDLLDGGDWRWVVDLPAGALALYHTARWDLRRSRQVRLLAVLHIAFLGLGLALLAYGAQSLVLLLTGELLLPRAPLHLLGLGFFGAMAVAMVSRVTLGHSGRPLVADRLIWTAFWLVVAAAWVRALAEHAPGWANPLAALLWLAAFLALAARFLPIYLLARPS